MLGTLSEKKDDICSCKNITFRVLKSVHKNHAWMIWSSFLYWNVRKNAWEATKLDKWIQCRKELYGNAIVLCAKSITISFYVVFYAPESHFMRTFMAMTSADHDNMIADWEEVCVIEMSSSTDFSFSSWCRLIQYWCDGLERSGTSVLTALAASTW